MRASVRLSLLINAWNFFLPFDLFSHSSITFEGLAPLVRKYLEQEGKRVGAMEEALHLHAFS